MGNYRVEESAAHRNIMTREKKKVCGIDVHKSFLVATILDRNDQSESRKFFQRTESLFELREWILSEHCDSVAFESTADYWRPLYLVLENRVPVTVANAHHIKHVPGRKTDITDSRWIAQLELNGLIEPSRVFSGDTYDLRSLTRSRELLIQNRTELKNKIHHLLDATSIRLSSVFTDIFGKSGMIVLKGIVHGKSLEEIVAALPKKEKRKASAIAAAVPATIPHSTLILLQSYLKLVNELTQEVHLIEENIREALTDKSREFQILTSIPGVGFIGAATLIAEIGNVHDFENADKLAKWAGLTPAVYQSANVTRTGAITKQGSRHIRWILVEIAHVAIRSPGKIRSFFERLLPKKGYKKSIVAVARKILRIAWHLLVHDEVFIDDFPRSKHVKLPKLPKKIQSIGIDKIIDLLSNASEVVIRDRNQDLVRLDLSD
jgi:transposase